MSKTIPLYEAPPNSLIKISDPDVNLPPEAQDVLRGELLKFHRIDGMYSYCVNSRGQVVHPAVWTQVEVVHE